MKALLRLYYYGWRRCHIRPLQALLRLYEGRSIKALLRLYEGRSVKALLRHYEGRSIKALKTLPRTTPSTWTHNERAFVVCWVCVKVEWVVCGSVLSLNRALIEP
jgi:hypothetical protein